LSWSRENHVQSREVRRCTASKIGSATALLLTLCFGMWTRSSDGIDMLWRLKFAHPDPAGSLAGKIKSLVKSQVIPGSLGGWADEIRLVGHDGADDDDVTLDDLRAAANVLRRILAIPDFTSARSSE